MSVKPKKQPDTYTILQELLHALAGWLLNYIRTCPSEKVRPGFLAVARALLKDQEISPPERSSLADREQVIEGLESLTGEDLPFH